MIDIDKYRKEEEYRDVVGVMPMEGGYRKEKQWTIPDRDMAFRMPFEDIDPYILESYGMDYKNPEDIVAMGVPRRRRFGQEFLDMLAYTASMEQFDPNFREKSRGIESHQASKYGGIPLSGERHSAFHVPPGYGPHGYYDEDLAKNAKDTLWIDQPQSLLNFATKNYGNKGIGQEGTGDNPSYKDYPQY